MRQRTGKIDGQHFAPAAADLVDGVAVLRGRAAYKAVEARQEQLLEHSEQLVDVVVGLEGLDGALVHVLVTHNRPVWSANSDNDSSRVSRANSRREVAC